MEDDSVVGGVSVRGSDGGSVRVSTDDGRGSTDDAVVNGCVSKRDHRAGVDGYSRGGVGYVDRGRGGMNGHVGGVRVVGVVHVVVGTAIVDEFDSRGGGLITNDLNDASSSSSGLLDVEDLGSLTLNDSADLSGAGLVVHDTHMMLFTRDSDLRDLRSSLRGFVHTNHLITGLDLLDANGLASRRGVDLMGANSGGGGGGHDSDIHGLNGGGSDRDLLNRGGGNGHSRDGRCSSISNRGALHGVDHRRRVGSVDGGRSRGDRVS